MAAMMNNIGGITDDMRARYEELKHMEQSGDLDDRGREELQQLRERFEQ